MRQSLRISCRISLSSSLLSCGLMVLSISAVSKIKFFDYLPSRIVHDYQLMTYNSLDNVLFFIWVHSVDVTCPVQLSFAAAFALGTIKHLVDV